MVIIIISDISVAPQGCDFSGNVVGMIEVNDFLNSNLTFDSY